MDRIKIISEKNFIGPDILNGEWRKIYKSNSNPFLNFWVKKQDGILIKYYSAKQQIQLDFSAPELLYGHNLFDYKVENNDLLYTKLNMSIADLVPIHFPSAEKWNVTYIEFTKNFTCTKKSLESRLKRIKKNKSIPHFKPVQYHDYKTGRLIANSTRVLRCYDKQAQIESDYNKKKRGVKINFSQLRMEIGYRNSNAIKRRFKTNKLGELLNQEFLTQEINELQRTFGLPLISDEDFVKTNNRQKNLIAYQNATYILKRALECCCTLTNVRFLLHAIALLNEIDTSSYRYVTLHNRIKKEYSVPVMRIRGISGWT